MQTPRFDAHSLTESRWNRTRNTLANTSVFVTREQRTIVQEPQAGEQGVPMSPIRSSANPQAQTITFNEPSQPAVFGQTVNPREPASTRLRTAASEDAEHAALTRLAYDLSLSLPIILFMSVCFPVLSTVGALMDQSSWPIRELAFDG